MGTQEKAEARIQQVLNRLTTEQVDNLAPDSGEFKTIAEAIMAWYQLLIASGIVQKGDRGIEVLSASMLVLATLVKYTYALGRQRGRKDRRVRKRA